MNPTKAELAEWLEGVGAVAELKGGPLTRCTVELSQTWLEIAQHMAKDSRLPYGGNVSGLVNFGLVMGCIFWRERLKRERAQTAATANLAE